MDAAAELEKTWREFIGITSALEVCPIFNFPTEPGAGRALESKIAHECKDKAKRRVIEAGGLVVLSSISHSRSENEGLAVAVACEGKDLLLGVGVDAEFSSRKISPGAVKKVLNNYEEQLGINVLDAWLAKEACFKADPNTKNVTHGTSVYHYVIKDFDLQSMIGEAMREGTNHLFQFKITNFGMWRIGFAKIYKESKV